MADHRLHRELRQLRRHPGHGRLVPVAHRHVHPRPGQVERDRPSETARPARHDRHLAFEPGPLRQVAHVAPFSDTRAHANEVRPRAMLARHDRSRPRGARSRGDRPSGVPVPSRAGGSPGGREVPLGIGAGRDGILYVPDTTEHNAPVILFLHGAGGYGQRVLRPIVSAADRYGAVVVAPDSRRETWDIIALQGFGPDVDFVEIVLNVVADECDVDFSRLAIGGISDGASYALSLGLINGDVFPSIVAFSPGFAVSAGVHGRPRVFISHGTHDRGPAHRHVRPASGRPTRHGRLCRHVPRVRRGPLGAARGGGPGLPVVDHRLSLVARNDPMPRLPSPRAA